MKKFLLTLCCLAMFSLQTASAFDGKSASYTITGNFSSVASAPLPVVNPLPKTIKNIVLAPNTINTKHKMKVALPSMQIDTKVKALQVSELTKTRQSALEITNETGATLFETLINLSKCSSGVLLHESSPSLPLVPYGFLLLEIIAGASFGFLMIGTFVLLLQNGAKK